MVANKVGSQKYYIIISLILGLMILVIALYWIFQEYFSEDDIDWEVCRQSILLRATLPEKDLVVLKTDVKGAFPLKCKTEVVVIDDLSTPDKVYKKIADAVAEGWYMFGEGEWDFVSREVWNSQTVCMVFARIHFDNEAVRKFEKKNFGDWMDYFIEKKYGVDPFREGFQDYYRSADIGKSVGTYDEYLSLYLDEEDISKNGNLAVYWKEIEFNPDRDGDYLLVYIINKRSGFVVGKLFKTKSWEGIKTVVLTSVDEVEVLQCDKFLTIPA